MPIAQIPIIRGDGKSDNIDFVDRLPVNLIAIPRQVLGANGYMLSHSGLELASQSQGRDRGAQWNDRQQEHYRVSGESFVSVSPSGKVSILGSMPGTDQISMAYSFNTQAVVAQGKYYLYDSVSGLRQVTDVDVGSPLDVCFIDGYYVFTDGEFLYHTEINDETQIDPLTFATPEIQPDETLAVGRDYDNKLIAFGRYTIEYFNNVASDDFAFTRIASRSKNVGIVGTHCKTQVDNLWIIMGGEKEEQVTLYAINASSTQKIATREVDKIIQKYSENELSKAVIESRVEDDIDLVIVRLPRETLIYNHTVAKTFGVDASWSIIRSSIKKDGVWGGANGVYDPRSNRWVYGDETENRLGFLNPDLASFYGQKVECIAYTPMVYLESSSIDDVEADTIPGDLVADINMFISQTYEGFTYGREYSMEYGRKANRQTRFKRYRLGYIAENVGFKLRAVTSGKISLSRFRISYD